MSNINGNKKQISIWNESCTLHKFKTLKTDLKTNILIIGGGIAGILCAYMLDQTGVDYVLAEASTICSGITKNTTAKITSQHGLIYHKLIKRFGTEQASLYLNANEAAVKKFKELCTTHNGVGIDCNFEEKDAYVYSLHNSQAISNEMDALSKINFSAQFVSKLPLPFSVAGAIKFSKQAQFHPLKFIQAISQNLNIYEHTAVTELVGCTAHTKHGTISANKIIAATHFPFINKHGSYFLKMYQHRSYCIALEHAPNINGMYVDEAEKGMSFRNYNDLLFLGGGDHRTGKSGGNWSELSKFAASHYPDAKEICRWSTQDCMTLDNVPYIGNYSKHTPNFYAATGFNKWGMTSSMVSAMLLTDLVTGKENPYTTLFSPSRSIFHPQLAVNALEASRNLLRISRPRCPHMGCALKWNAAEHSYDCPCHGSRFSKEGELIDNPAAGNLKL